MSLLKKIAIAINGNVVPARREPQAQAPAPAVRTVCRPSNGGLGNPSWKYTSGSDLRATMGSLTK